MGTSPKDQYGKDLGLYLLYIKELLRYFWQERIGLKFTFRMDAQGSGRLGVHECRNGAEGGSTHVRRARLPLIHCTEITLPLRALSPIPFPPHGRSPSFKALPRQTAQAVPVFRPFSYKHGFNKNPSRIEISGPPTLHLFLCSHQYMLFQFCLKRRHL